MTSSTELTAQPLALRRNCPICESQDTDTAFVNTMAALDGMDMSYTVGRCMGCGFHFASQLPRVETYSRYYRSVSKYDVPQSVAPVDQTRIAAAVAFCEGKIPKDASVLDLGCGYGAMLAGFAAAGWLNLQGIDPAPLSAQRAKAMFGLRGISQGTMAEAGAVVDLSSIDLVCIMAVIEHLPALRSDLKGLLAQLKPGTQLLIEVPAMELFQAEGSEPFGELSLEHIQFFSTAALCNLMVSLGANTLATQQVDIPLVKSGSLFGLFEWTGDLHKNTPTLLPDIGGGFQDYLTASARTLAAALQRIPPGPVLVYGAGSHTARLLPPLQAIAGMAIQGIVDGNSNLTNKKMGQWTIESPEAIARWPDTPILISSFRSQTEIAKSLGLRFPNPLILMY